MKTASLRWVTLTASALAVLALVVFTYLPARAKAPEAAPLDAKAKPAADTKPKPTADAKASEDTKPKPVTNTKLPADTAKTSGVQYSKQWDFVSKDIQPGDWNQWGGSPSRNNTPEGKNIPTDWNVGQFDDDTGEWKAGSGKNIKWVARLGSQSYPSPVVANGRIVIGSNNGNGYVKRYPASVDLGVLLCFDEATGKFLWQHSNEKLPSGRVNDWLLQGICSTALIEGKRLWYVSSRGEVNCLDLEGFYDGKNNGPVTDEPSTDKDEADVIWRLNMMKQLGVFQHNMCACSVTAVGDQLYVITGNGVDEGHVNLPAPQAPSFLCLDKNTGKVIWTDNTPGNNVLHGQWSSPAYAILGGVPQVIFAGGDGWLYSFMGNGENDHGKPKLLWKFDCNPKESKYVLGSGATRNHLIATPVIYDGLIYIAVGEDPEHGEGNGHLWCIDPTKRGDVSMELAVNRKDPKTPIPIKRNQAVVAADGDMAIPNPNSAAVWHYEGDGKKFEETMHRTPGTCAIKDGLLYVADFSGLFHCLDAKTGKSLWTHDMLAECWASPLIVDGKVYIGNADGNINIFKLSGKKELISTVSMDKAVYSTPIVAHNVLYISNMQYLFAIESEESKAAAKDLFKDSAKKE